MRISTFGWLMVAYVSALLVHAEPSQVITMPMADGIRLSADLYLPNSQGAHAVVLVRTPYGKGSLAFLGQGLAEAGFAVVIQDVRGKFASEGQAEPLLAERKDSADSLDWLAKQPWCNGKIGMWGTSYLGYCALVPALEQHPNLKALFMNSAYVHSDQLAMVGGANHLLLNLPWLWYASPRTNQSVDDVEFEDLFLYTPLSKVFTAHGMRSGLWAQPEQFRSFNNDLSARSLQVPTFHMTGWLDFVKEASLEIFQQAAAHSRAPQRLWIGPWFHDQCMSEFTEGGDEDFGPQSVLGNQGMLTLTIAWFREHLQDIPDTVHDPRPVRFFMMGDHQWHHSTQWPPQGWRRQVWYLHSEKGANSLAGDGRLSRALPAVDGKDQFVYDPHQPVPTLGGANFHFFLPLLGVRDQRMIEARRDVLVYTAPPVREKQWLTGPVTARLFVSTEGPDTDFTAKLVLVQPDGYARIVEESIVRLSALLGKKKPLGPNQIVPIDITLGHTAIAVPKGHRIRLEVSSSNFPKYDRNPNTGADPFTATEFRKVTNRVHFGPEHHSTLVLPLWRPPASNTATDTDKR